MDDEKSDNERPLKSETLTPLTAMTDSGGAENSWA